MAINPASSQSGLSLVPCESTVSRSVKGARTEATVSRDCSGDLFYDGAIGHVSMVATDKNKPEFRNTDVIEINGINYDTNQQHDDAKTVSRLVHQNVTTVHAGTTGSAGGDVAEGAFPDKFGVESAAEDSLYEQMRTDIDSGKNVHLFAHSRGALVAQNALDKMRFDDYDMGMTDAQVKKDMSHVTVETFGGAGKEFPDGVKTINYVSGADPIGNTWGKGRENADATNVLRNLAGFANVKSSAIDRFVPEFTQSLRAIGAINSLVGGMISGEGNWTRHMHDSVEDTNILVPTRTATNDHPTPKDIQAAILQNAEPTLEANHSMQWLLQHRVTASDAINNTAALRKTGDVIER